jgi:hypothetical protein
VNVGSGVGLARLSQKVVPLLTMRQFLGLCSETFGLLLETFRESQSVFETEASFRNMADYWPKVRFGSNASL